MSFLSNVPRPPPPTVVDSFEDGDIAEYGGQTGAWQVATTPVADGTFAVQETFSNGDRSGRSISSTSGLPVYPSQGDTLRFNAQLSDVDGEIGIMFFTQSATSLPDNYAVTFRFFESQIALTKRQSGNFSKLATATVTAPPTGEMLEGRVDIGQSGTFTFEAFDSSGNSLGSITGSDGSFMSGGIGVKAFHFDNDASDFTGTVDFIRIE